MVPAFTSLIPYHLLLSSGVPLFNCQRALASELGGFASSLSVSPGILVACPFTPANALRLLALAGLKHDRRPLSQEAADRAPFVCLALR
jgi:hypothetical protein